MIMKSIFVLILFSFTSCDDKDAPPKPPKISINHEDLIIANLIMIFQSPQALETFLRKIKMSFPPHLSDRLITLVMAIKEQMTQFNNMKATMQNIKEYSSLIIELAMNLHEFILYRIDLLPREKMATNIFMNLTK